MQPAGPQVREGWSTHPGAQEAAGRPYPGRLSLPVQWIKWGRCDPNHMAPQILTASSQDLNKDTLVIQCSLILHKLHRDTQWPFRVDLKGEWAYSMDNRCLHMGNRAQGPILNRASLHITTNRAFTLHSSKHHHSPSILNSNQLPSLTANNRLLRPSLLPASLCSPISPNSSSLHLLHPTHSNSSRVPPPVHKASHHIPNKLLSTQLHNNKDHPIRHQAHSRGVLILSNASLHHRSSLRIPLHPRLHQLLLWVPAKDKMNLVWGCSHDLLAFQISLVPLMISLWVLRVLLVQVSALQEFPAVRASKATQPSLHSLLIRHPTFLVLEDLHPPQ